MITITEYKEQALQTVKDHATKEMAIADWALGLGGEAGEVIELYANSSTDRMELAKELGDVLWYTIALANEVEIDFPASTFEELDTYVNRSHCVSCIAETNPLRASMFNLMINTCTIQERMKHAIMHKEGFEANSIEGKLGNVLAELAAISKHSGFSLYDVAKLNAAKLAHRYNIKNGGQYSVEASADRHAIEARFEDTVEYKELHLSITGTPC